MGQVSVTLNNRTYRLACNDGEEQRLAALAAEVKTRVESLAREFGHSIDERILLMAAVLLADELMDLREAHEAMLSAAADVLREASAAGTSAAGTKPDTRGRGVTGKPEPAKPGAPKSVPAKTDMRAEVTQEADHPALPPQSDRPRSSAG